MILSILDINYFKKQAIVYLIISIFCFVFGRVYEMFSHNVYSSYMMNSYLIPLFFGFFASLTMFLLKLNKITNRISINLYNASIATFTIYSIFKGILEIYGTTNKLINIYLYIGILLFIISIAINFYQNQFIK